MKTPESVSTMQYHCLSLAEIGEDEEENIIIEVTIKGVI